LLDCRQRGVGEVERADSGALQSRKLVGLPALTAIRGEEHPSPASHLRQPVDVEGSRSELIPASLYVEAQVPEGGGEVVSIDVRVEEEGR
jgi:hypothetical protein